MPPGKTLPPALPIVLIVAFGPVRGVGRPGGADRVFAEMGSLVEKLRSGLDPRADAAFAATAAGAGGPGRLNWPPGYPPARIKTSRGGPEPWTGNAAITSRLSTCWLPGCSCPRRKFGNGGAALSRSAWRKIPTLRRWRVLGSGRCRRPTSTRCEGDRLARNSRRQSPKRARGPRRGSRPSSSSRSVPASWRTWISSSCTTGRADLLAIGYNVDDRRLDASFYDLLASEARLASFVGIAQGRLPQEHWFALGRLLTATRAGPVLISWSGSMFEYLMPQLVMPTYRGHVARPDVPGGRRAAGRVRRRARRALGHLGVGLQHDRRPSQLSVPRVRRAGAGAEARPCRGPGHRAVRHGHGADGGARDGIREPAADGRRGFPGTLRVLRGDRLHALAAAARAVERGHSLVHGTPPGDELSVAGLRSAGPADAAAV